MKIGLLTLPIVDNIGGILQASALYRVLCDMGHDPVLLEKKFWRPASQQLIGKMLRAVPGHDIKKVRSIAKARARHMPYLDRFMPNRVGAIYTKSALAKAIQRHGLDAVVVGSDQVWRPDYIEDVDTGSYFLDVEGDFLKISYAASFGKSQWTAPHRLDEVRKMIADFDAVSLRETTGVDLCRSELGRDDCTMTIDPTLLVAPEFYEEIAPPAPTGAPYLLNYSLDQTGLTDEAVARALDGPAAGCGVRLLTLDGNGSTASVPEWIQAFRNARYVVTDSFHGTVFSILFRKPFVSIGNFERGVDRFISILSLLGIPDRLIVKASDLQIVDQPVPYDDVVRRLEAMRADSDRFLHNALAGRSQGARNDRVAASA